MQGFPQLQLVGVYCFFGRISALQAGTGPPLFPQVAVDLYKNIIIFQGDSNIRQNGARGGLGKILPQIELHGLTNKRRCCGFPLRRVTGSQDPPSGADPPMECVWRAEVGDIEPPKAVPNPYGVGNVRAEVVRIELTAPLAKRIAYNEQNLRLCVEKSVEKYTQP